MSITVAELIEELQQLDPESEVRIGYDYGDHWNTTVAKDIKAVEDDARVVWNDRLQAYKYDEEGEAAGESKLVVLIMAEA